MIEHARLCTFIRIFTGIFQTVSSLESNWSVIWRSDRVSSSEKIFCRDSCDMLPVWLWKVCEIFVWEKTPGMNVVSALSVCSIGDIMVGHAFGFRRFELLKYPSISNYFGEFEKFIGTLLYFTKMLLWVTYKDISWADPKKVWKIRLQYIWIAGQIWRLWVQIIGQYFWECAFLFLKCYLYLQLSRIKPPFTDKGDLEFEPK